jgi:aspartate racemase
MHIGIVGCSAPGAALCYETICHEGGDHPEVSMHTHSLAKYMECINRNDWDGVGDLMLDSAEKLANGGADFLICPDNTIHQAFDYVKARSPLPWIHIADAVTAEAAARGFTRVGLTGTRWLVNGPVYPENFIRPAAGEREEINRIIFEELVNGVFKPEAVVYFQGVIRRMKDHGCDAVALCCTEIPLIMNDANSPLPVLDSTRLLARAALRRATGSARPDRGTPSASGR